MSKSFINISYVGIGNMLNAALGFLYITAVAKILPVDDFGKYALLTATLILVSKILDFGTNSLFVSDTYGSHNTKTSYQFFTLKLVLLIISVPVSLLVLTLLNLPEYQIWLYFFVGMVSYGISYYLFGIFQKTEKYAHLVFLNMIPALIKGTTAILIFTEILTLTYTGYFAVFAFALAPSILMYFFLPEEYKKLGLNFSLVTCNLKKAFSPGMAQLINESFSSLNGFLTKIFLNLTSLGVFSLADKISSVFTLVSYTIFTVLLPKNAKRKKESHSYDLVETSVLALGVFCFAVVLILGSKILIPWFFHHKYDESLGILSILVFSSAFTATHVFLENYFYVENKTKYLAFIYLFKLIFAVTLSIKWLPHYNIYGLAWAQFISSMLTLLAMITIMYKDLFGQYPKTS